MDEVALVRVRNRMSYVDELPPRLREVVHEHGLAIVKAFIECGVTDPKRINHLVNTVREGSGEVGNRNRSERMKIEIDNQYAGYLRGGGYLVVPKIPTQEMVAASVSALDDAGLSHTVVDRARKHAVRLIHANVAGHSERFGKVS